MDADHRMDRRKWSISFWRKQTWATSVHPSRKSDRHTFDRKQCFESSQSLWYRKRIHEYLGTDNCRLTMLSRVPVTSWSLSIRIDTRTMTAGPCGLNILQQFLSGKKKQRWTPANYGNWGDAVVKRNSLSKNIKFYLNWISASIRANIECPRNAIAPTHFHSALGQTRNELDAHIGRARSPLWVTITLYRDIERVSYTRIHTRIQNPSICSSTSIRVIPTSYRCKL